MIKKAIPYTISVLCFLIHFSAYTQHDTLTVNSIYSSPDIHPDSLYHFIEDIATFDSIRQNGVLYEDLPPSEQQLYEKQAFLEHGPFYTGAYGCSWYCVNKPISIQSSPTLKASKIENYIPENIHDFDLRTAWVSDNKKVTYPEINFELETSSDTQQVNIVIFNGFSKNIDAWNEYQRAKTIELSIFHHKYILLVEDHYYGQVFKLPYQIIGHNNKTTIRFKVLDTYGNKKKPLAISEINFDGSTSIH